MRVFRGADLAGSDEFFQILETTDRCQVAVMVLADGETSGEHGTDHPHADQVLIVLEGGGEVRCEEETVRLAPGDVAIIPAGARHQVFGPNRTLNVYMPVAYPA